MEGAAPAEEKKEEAKEVSLPTYVLIQQTDMPEDIATETSELFSNACEKFADDNGAAAKMIKETLDQKFGPAWQVVVGQGFGFDMEYEQNTLLFLFLGGNLGGCAWKCP